MPKESNRTPKPKPKLFNDTRVENGIRTSNPDHAWKALSLVNEWIRHSDAKAGVTLAFVGALSFMVFRLSHEFQGWDGVSVAVVLIVSALLVGATLLSGLTLIPRTLGEHGTANADLLFFASIAANYAKKRNEFQDELAVLTSDDDALTVGIARQIHSNALIATTKARNAKWAMVFLLIASVAVGLLALIISCA